MLRKIVIIALLTLAGELSGAAQTAASSTRQQATQKITEEDNHPQIYVQDGSTVLLSALGVHVTSYMQGALIAQIMKRCGKELDIMTNVTDARYIVVVQGYSMTITDGDKVRAAANAGTVQGGARFVCRELTSVK